jgi:hypothetical protein
MENTQLASAEEGAPIESHCQSHVDSLFRPGGDCAVGVRTQWHIIKMCWNVYGAMYAEKDRRSGRMVWCCSVPHFPYHEVDEWFGVAPCHTSLLMKWANGLVLLRATLPFS